MSTSVGDDGRKVTRFHGGHWGTMVQFNYGSEYVVVPAGEARQLLADWGMSLCELLPPAPVRPVPADVSDPGPLKQPQQDQKTEQGDDDAGPWLQVGWHGWEDHSLHDPEPDADDNHNEDELNQHPTTIRAKGKL